MLSTRSWHLLRNHPKVVALLSESLGWNAYAKSSIRESKPPLIWKNSSTSSLLVAVLLLLVHNAEVSPKSQPKLHTTIKLSWHVNINVLWPKQLNTYSSFHYEICLILQINIYFWFSCGFYFPFCRLPSSRHRSDPSLISLCDFLCLLKVYGLTMKKKSVSNTLVIWGPLPIFYLIAGI